MTLPAMESFWSPLWLSLLIGALAVVIATPLGALLAWWLHGRRRAWVTLLESAILLPLVFPPTVLGFYLLVLLGRNGPVGKATLWMFETTLLFTPLAAVVAAVVVAVPILYRTIKIEFEALHPDVLGSARIEGASESSILFHIRLPLAARSIFAGLTLAFLRALGEFGATLMIAGNIPGKTQTLALAIWSAVSAGDIGQAHRYAGVLVVMSLGLIAALRLIEGRVTGAGK